MGTNVDQAAKLCDVHNCGEPIEFVQAPGEAPGVGRWRHVNPVLNRADHHAARPPA